VTEPLERIGTRPALERTGYQWLIGDVDGVNATDLIWVRSTTAAAAVHRSLNLGSASFSTPAGQTAAIGAGTVGYVADFNNDGEVPASRAGTSSLRPQPLRTGAAEGH
jgi:hypothetical protein